ncbi:MAG: type II toxin-antitoxin system RelE family toxin [Minisyncoccota bacterium]
MLEVEYAASFIRQFKKLDDELQDEILERIDLFKSKKNHQFLEVHKLHGELANRYGFSINYRARVIFTYARNRRVAQLLAVGGHEIYD